MPDLENEGDADRLGNSHPLLSNWWHPVARTDDLPAGDLLPVQLLGVDYVLFRAGSQLAALTDECPHRRAPLSRGELVDGTIRCGYHGWRFAADGRCVAVPALGDAPPRREVRASAVPVHEVGGMIWVAPAIPPGLPVDLSEPDTAMEVRLPAIRAHVGAGMLIENFLDVAHFPFVHRESFGMSRLSADRIARLGAYTIRRSGASLHAGGGHACTDEHPGTRDQCRLEFAYRYHVPFAAAVSLRHSATGARSASIMLVQPETEGTSRIFYSVVFNAQAAEEVDLQEVLAFESRIMEEDLLIQAAFRDDRLHLRHSREASTAADRLTLTYRSVLHRALSTQPTRVRR